ncbi:MAG: 2,3,4,5-tetrahydropyridine-2,6-dicarboxylate N-acetyltransferase [Cetobacterium sp.]|uniref:2,3,4,5-tetrahydropyridine-2,6-dicarboxylate N-acetyltransferase n=1 Tax=Cetobacterium sp. TaxID=2071632 RepID=UPI0025ED8DD8|nr:2,3,4,5-tetrahydropyridine-2,6-dicarboxylate N-acetyltransferase [uncultured Cetobacterium sp.]
MRLETAEELISFIKNSKKKTLSKVYINGSVNFENDGIFTFKGEEGVILIGDWQEISIILEANKETIKNYFVENVARNSGVPLLDTKAINARIEPGAIIRDKVKIGDNAVIMMGAVINIGAEIGEGTMIDMNAVLGGRAIVGKRCHVGAGTVLAGVIEPPSAQPVIVEDDVMIGANAVVIEGVRIGKGSVVAAGAIVLEDVPAGAVVAGNPAKVVKLKDEKTSEKTKLVDDLRK